MSIRTLTLLLVAAFLAVLVPSPASAQVELSASGRPGPVSLLTFNGAVEGYPTSQTDVGQAAVQCFNNALARKAVLAGASVWAYNARRGWGNDAQRVVATAAAMTSSGRVVVGEMSTVATAYDHRPVRFGPLTVALPRDRVQYTPFLLVQFFDAASRLQGTRWVAPQTGAWQIQISTPPYGDWWYVARTSVVSCA